MDISKYALFADVADTGNFTKSGERMGYPQPGVSHILKAMNLNSVFHCLSEQNRVSSLPIMPRRSFLWYVSFLPSTNSWSRPSVL